MEREAPMKTFHRGGRAELNGILSQQRLWFLAGRFDVGSYQIGKTIIVTGAGK